MPAVFTQSPAPEYGRRLVPHVIDCRAQNEPTKVFASIPRSKDLGEGFVDVTYALLANAINKASWWLSQSMGNVDTPEVFAYMGPNDLRYPILLAAAMKCGYQMMLPSPRNSAEYQQELLQRAKCHTIFCTRGLMARSASLLEDLDIFYKIAPELDELLEPTPVAPFLYDAIYDEVKKNPFLILHTSGSTGPPKPITFTIECTTTEDTHRLLDDPSGRLWWRLFANRRYFMGMPCYHSAGIWFSLFIPVFFNSTVVFGPGERPLTAAIAHVVHQTAQVNGGIYPPSVLEDISRTDNLNGVKHLEFIAYGGGPLSKEAGDRLSRLTILHNFIGFTEASAPPRYVMEAEDWNYFEFHPAAGFTLEHIHSNLYRMVFQRLPEYEHVQTAFRLFPELDKYSPGDILSPHPSKPNLWTYGGRTDDLIVLSTGEKFNPIPAELMLKGCSAVKDTLIVGDGQAQAALLVECNPAVAVDMTIEDVLEELWPFIQRVNMALPTQGRLLKTNIIISPAGKEFSRSPKGSVQRKITIANFEAELNALYLGQKQLPNGSNTHNQLVKENNHRQLAKVNTDIGLPVNAQYPATHATLSSPTSTTISPITMRLPMELDLYDSISLSITSISKQEDRPFDGDNRDVKECGQHAQEGAANTLSCIRDTLRDLCGIYVVDDDDDLFELGLDSISALQISNELRDLSPAWPQDHDSSVQKLYANPTVRGLADAVSRAANYRSVMATPSPVPGELVRASMEMAVPQPSSPDAIETGGYNAVEELIQAYTADLSDGASKRAVTVVLTGSTGAVGSHLLDRLKKEPKVAKIFCLNRSKDGVRGQAAANARNGISPTSSIKLIEYFTIDLSQPFLGLTPHQYAALQHEADVIIHNAWKLDFLQTVKSFEKMHIAGVRHLVDMAANSNRHPRIVFLSSVASCFGWQKEQSIPEEILLSATAAGNNGYGQSKHIAERILYEASKTSSIRATVVRLGQISGPTSAGVGIWNSSDWVPQIISTSKSLRAIPKTLGMANDVDWLPIDCLPGILLDLIYHDLESPERFHVYHAVNPNSVSWGSLLPAVCHRLGSDVELVSYQQWLAMLCTKVRKEGDIAAFPAIRLISWLQQLDAPSSVKMPSFSIEKIAKSSAMFSRLAPISGKWMENWINTWLQ